MPVVSNAAAQLISRSIRRLTLRVVVVCVIALGCVILVLSAWQTSWLADRLSQVQEQTPHPANGDLTKAAKAGLNDVDDSITDVHLKNRYVTLRSLPRTTWADSSLSSQTRTVRFLCCRDPSYVKNSLFTSVRDAWKQQNPTWNMVIHPLSEIAALLSTSNYSSFAPAYAHMSDIERWDFGRVLLVYHHGGLYLDADAETPGVMIETMLRDSGFDPAQHDVAFFRENTMNEQHMRSTMARPLRHGTAQTNVRIANYALFAVRPGAAVLYTNLLLVAFRVMALHALSPPSSEQTTDYAVLYASGPDATTETAFSAFDGSSSVALVQRAVVVQRNGPRHRAVGSWRMSTAKAVPKPR